MKNLLEVTRQDIINVRDKMINPSELNSKRISSITVGRLTISEINSAWSYALKKHTLS
jgi:hypothetical protein